MATFSNQYVRPLGEASNEFIQVLLEKFSLSRTNGRTTCEVAFNNDTSCIWTGEGKTHVRQNIVRFDRVQAQYKTQLAKFLASPNGKYTFSDPNFPFRFVSGGALPVIRMNGIEYFALIYREIFPVGWNLANGGSDSPAELLNPFGVAARELREELIILNRKHGRRYFLKEEEHTENPLDMPEYLIARCLWRTQLMRKGWPDIACFKSERLPMKWLDGPDTLRIRGNGKDFTEQPDCYLNIRAEDFGIEVDRIAKLNLDDNAVLLDGELIKGKLIGAPIGLFEVRRMAALITNGSDEFLPDFFFYDGMRYDGKTTTLQNVLSKKFLPHTRKIRPNWDYREWTENRTPFNLCPVARGVLERAANKWNINKPRASNPAEYDVFISFAEPDTKLANEVYKHVRVQMDLKAYFSKEEAVANYQGKIEKALDSANCLIAVGSAPEHFERPWPLYEQSSFHSDILSGKKPENAGIIPFVKGMEISDCPRYIRRWNGVRKDVEGKNAMNRLSEIISLTQG